MKILTTLTASGGMNLGSNAKDQFVIGSELERDNVNADELKVWANANFFNDVTIGSSSVDLFNIKAGTVNLPSGSLYNSATKIFYVATSGSDSNSGTSSSEPLATIQAAVDKIATISDSAQTRVQFHNTIFIASGTYTEKVKIIGKGLAGNKSPLLANFVGEKEFLYTNLTCSDIVFLDTDSGRDDGLRALTLNISPEQDSLIGNFIVTPNGLDSGVITSHSGSNFYVSCTSLNFTGRTLSGFSGSGVSIYKPVSVVNGYIAAGGCNGSISFTNLRVEIGLNDGGGSETFGLSGFVSPIGTIDTGSTGTVTGSLNNTNYSSYHRDSLFINNCQLIRNAGTFVYIAPTTRIFNSFISSSTNFNVQASSYVDEFNFVGSFAVNASFNLFENKVASFFHSCLKDSSINTRNCYSVVMPTKMVSSAAKTSEITFSNITIPNNSLLKNIKLLGTRSRAQFNGPSTILTDEEPVLDIQQNSIAEFRGINNNFYFSGSVSGSNLVKVSDASYVDVIGTLNFSEIYRTGSFANVGGFINVYDSNVYFATKAPVVPTSGSANYNADYYDFNLDGTGINLSQIPYQSERSRINFELSGSAYKTSFIYPLTASNLIVTSSVTSDNGYKINSNDVVAKAQYALSLQSYGTGSYESGSVFKDAFGASSAEIIVGRLSSSLLNRNQDVIDFVNSGSGVSIWQDGIDFYSPDGFISLQQIISAVNGGGGGSGSYADSAVFESSSSYEQYSGGTGSYFSGTVVKDASNASNGQIEIGHLSASAWGINDDIVRLNNGNSRITMYSDDIKFEFVNNNQLLISEIYNALNGGGGGGGSYISTLQSTGSGESLVRDVNNGTGSLRSLKSTSTINVVQQTNELELSVNSNLTLTSITSQGTLTVSGNVQLNDSTSDTTTIQGILKLNSHHPLPSGELGMIALSGSLLYFYNGNNWTIIVNSGSF